MCASVAGYLANSTSNASRIIENLRYDGGTDFMSTVTFEE